MNLTIFMAGLACIIAAIVGGGLTMAGVTIPTLGSWRRQALLAFAGAIVVGVSFLGGGGGSGSNSSGQLDQHSPTTSVYPQPPSRVETTISLSKSEGPPGTALEVSGSGFGTNETVDIRFSTRALAKTQTDNTGVFAPVTVQIPPDWQFKNQVDIVATGRQTLRWTSEPFLVK